MEMQRRGFVASCISFVCAPIASLEARTFEETVAFDAMVFDDVIVSTPLIYGELHPLVRSVDCSDRLVALEE